MTDAATDLRRLIDQQGDAIVADWRARLLAFGGSYAGGLTSAADLHTEMKDLLGGLQQAMAEPETGPGMGVGPALAQVLRAASQVRAARGFSPEESVLFVQTCKDAVIASLGSTGQADAAGQLARQDLFTRLIDRCVMVLVSSFVAAREEVIRSQAESLREMSTPVITLWESILLLPLVGIIDSVRARQVSERLLEAIGRTEAAVTLIDVTGVPVMDTSVARHILKTVAAAEMLGTQVVLTGISPNTAQTMVKLGIDLSAVPTRGSLKAGVALALTLTRRQVVDRQD
jgi:rsbT co-antagonist protein RsbR